MHKINQIFPPKIDLDLEKKLIMDLTNKLANPNFSIIEINTSTPGPIKSSGTKEEKVEITEE